MTDMVLIIGDTYPVRAQLRAMGGQWDAQSKGWRVPSAKANAARALVLRPEEPRSCRQCRGPLRDASHHRAMEGLCGECAFDEFDM